MLDPFFNIIFGFLLNWPPIFAILFLSAVISVIIVGITKLFTDQKEMKRLKEELSGHQKKMKELKDDPEKMLEIQKKAMSTNMQYMGKSMKSTLFTFIPLLLIFGWMQGHFAYEPLAPGEPFTLKVILENGAAGNVSITVPEGLEVIGEPSWPITDHTVTFQLKGDSGDYFATLSSNGQEVDKAITITTERKYAAITETYKSDVFKSAQLGNKTLKVFWKISWFWAYLIFAMVFSIVLRKAIKVY